MEAVNLGVGLGVGLGVPAVVLVVIAIYWFGACRSCSSKEAADALPLGAPNCPHVIRLPETPRPGWNQKLLALGMRFGTNPGVNWGLRDVEPYWNESASYRLTPVAQRQLTEATQTLHGMCLAAVDRVVGDATNALLREFEIPENLWAPIRQSWRERRPDVIGRFDLLYNGRDPPKMSEYNADTPTVLVETAVVQANWQQEKHPSAGQINNMVECLRAAWRRAVPDRVPIIFISPGGKAVEEADTAALLARSASEAGYETRVGTIHDVTFDAAHHRVLFRGEEVRALWKHYPLEWLADEELAAAVEDPKAFARCRWMEPPWKLILGNKALLALLWEMFPGHKNLLPAFYSSDHFQKRSSGLRVAKWVSKPRWGREGWGVDYFLGDPTSVARALRNTAPPITVELGYGNSSGSIPLGRNVYQEFYPTPSLSGRSFVVGSWVIGGRACGVCFREERAGGTINDNSCFVPHWVDETNGHEGCYSDTGSESEDVYGIRPLRAELYGRRSLEQSVSRTGRRARRRAGSSTSSRDPGSSGGDDSTDVTSASSSSYP